MSLSCCLCRYSPNIKEIRVVNHRKVRRARLYYLREKLPRLSTFKWKTPLQLLSGVFDFQTCSPNLGILSEHTNFLVNVSFLSRFLHYLLLCVCVCVHLFIEIFHQKHCMHPHWGENCICQICEQLCYQLIVSLTLCISYFLAPFENLPNSSY